MNETKPPEGYRVLCEGEVIREGDVYVSCEGYLKQAAQDTWAQRLVGERWLTFFAPFFRPLDRDDDGT